MTNFSTAVKASGEALNSQGSAMKENEKYMESIKARVQAVKNELQEMILKSDLNKLIKSFLSLAETILKVQNAIGGLKPLLTFVAGILITFNIDKMVVGIGKVITLLKSDVFTKFLTSMVDFDLALKSLIKGEGIYITETETATVATEGYGLALSSLQTIIGMITIAITLLVVAVNAYNSAQEEHSRKAHEFVEEEQEQINKINELINKIDTEKLSRESLNEIISENLKKYEEEISKIDDVNEARKRTIELLEKEKETEAKKIVASASATYEKESKKLENFSFGSKFKFGFNSTERAARKASERYKEYVNPDGTTEDFINYIIEQRNKLKENSDDVNAYLTIFGFSSKEEAQETFNYIQNQYEELTESVNNFENSLRRLGYVYENNQLISIEDTLNKGSDYYGKGNAESIFKEIQQAKEEYKLTDGEALIVKENLKKYGYDIKETIEQLQLGTVKQSKEAEDELAGFVEVFGLTEQQQADIIANLANNDFDIGATIESLGIPTEVLDSWNEFAEETEEANKFLEETGLKENVLQKQIGISSTNLVRQANEWGVNTKYLYDYLTALNKFDESLDNVQSNYNTLKSAVDEYNESGGFSIDTLQQLLKLSPEYLQTIFDENGELRLQNGILELNEQAIKDKVSAMAAEAKQDIYNNAVKRINNLSTDENVRKMIESKEAFDDTTNAIKKNSDSLVENAEATYLNAVSKARLSGKTTKNQLINQIMKETEEQISLIDNMVEKLGKDFSGTMNLNTKSTNETNSALKEQNQLLKQQKQELQDKKKQYEDVIGYIKKKIQDEIKKIEEEKKKQVESIKEQIDAIKELKDAELDSIQEQIDKLKEKQDEEEEYWQKKIDALKEQNDELNTQLEYEQLLQDLAKAKAKRVRVYEEGKGFVYKEDTNEIDKAQSKLDEFNRKQSYEKQLKQLEEYKKKSKENYDKQIKDLEDLKDEKEKNYDKQIKDLEDYQKKVEADYDARIKYFQDYLDKFTAETDAYENEVNRQLAIQLTGIDFEQQGWQTRLDNLANFVEKYNALLGDIHTLDGVEDTTTETTEDPEKTKKEPNKTRGQEIADEAKKNIENERKKIEEAKNKAKVKKKASGDSYISEDGVYLVGDSPNQELVIGSRINGSLMNLTQGSGVVNSTSTRTLAGILNQLGVIGNQGVNMSNSHNKSTNISIGNISLPSVQNGKDFVDYLQNFSLQMTQEAFA